MVDDARAREELSAAGFTPEGFTIATHLSCLKASAAEDAAYGPGFEDLSEVEKFHV